MTSTSTSENVVLELDQVNLVFRTDVYRPWTWRDAFTQLAKNPVAALGGSRDRLHVTRDITLKISKGERVALIGRNGAGKTSLCRCIAGMYMPTSGLVTAHGEVRAVFDTGLGIQPELTGRENARLLMEFMFPSAEDKEGLIAEALEFSELGDFVDVPYRTYSNGMQARLCLSIISCLPSDLLILDEVFEGADAFFRAKISRRVHEMIERSGAVIFVSHSETQIEKVCNRAIVLEGGTVAFDGDVETAIAFYKKS